MRSIYKSIIGFIMISLLVFSQYAQSSVRSCRFILLESPEDYEEDMYLFDGTKSTKIQYSIYTLSPIYELPHGDIELVLSPKIKAQNKNLPDNAVKVLIDEDLVEILLVLRIEPENKEQPIKALVIDVGDDKIKLGQTLWLNYTANTISAELGDKVSEIKPDSQAISDVPLSESGFLKAEFSYKTPDAEIFSPIMKKSWWLDISSKNIGFIVNDKNRRLPKIFMMRDKR